MVTSRTWSGVKTGQSTVFIYSLRGEIASLKDADGRVESPYLNNNIIFLLCPKSVVACNRIYISIRFKIWISDSNPDRNPDFRPQTGLKSRLRTKVGH